VLPKAAGWGIFSAVLAWVRDPMWMGGIAVQTLGYATYVGALSGAPVSMVAVMMQGGIAMFVVFAIAFLGERAAPREWIGIGAIVAGMMLLGLSLSAGAPSGTISPIRLAETTVALVLISTIPMARGRLRDSGIMAAVVSGLAFGLGSLYTKAMTNDYLARPGVELVVRIAADPYVYGAVVANVSGVVLLQNAFHSARGIVALPISSALSNLVPIAGGIIAFGEFLPTDHFAAGLRIGAFGLTVAASALLAGTGDPAAVRVAPS
jgi:drug/metabolite transporter (DMT)-like permease